MGRPSTSSRGSDDPKAELEPPSSSPLSLGAVGASVMGGSPSPARVPPRFLIDLLEEEAIASKQGREEEEKEKEKEEKKLGFGCSECVL
jgi:hypothetical protein